VQADRLLSDLESQYQRARECGFPAFVQSIDESTPLNATPYVVSLRQFVAGDWPAGRRALLDALLATIARLPQHGARAEIVLVGGSFLDASRSPRDLDAALFYSRCGDAPPDLAQLQDELRASCLDLRLLPLDIAPVMVLKMALYFGVLYTRGREAQPQLRGLVLVDCTAAHGDATGLMS
jgi:hypothetical protein